jgi:hypothetical protein
MSHTIELPDELYRAIERYAAQRGETAESFILAWAESLATTSPPPLPEQTPEEMSGYVYDPAEDPLAEFLGTGELSASDAIRRHDEAIAAEALDAHRE